jgi:DNA-binding NarL/FixJ family response regulator
MQLQRECVIESIPRLRQNLPDLGILIYSASDNPIDEARSFSGGANGYLCRTTRRESLVAALRRVTNGEKLWTGADQRRLSSYLRDGRPTAGSFAPLTPREQEILRLVTTGATNREISQALGISHETVKEHVQHLLKKIGVNDRTQAAVWAVRRGIA